MTELPAGDLGYLVITAVDHGPPFAERIFQRKYRASAPDFPLHFVTFWRTPDDAFVPVHYTHFTRFGESLLIGGSCTDGDVLRRMPPEQQAGLHALGGPMYLTVRYALARLEGDSDATFGHCGDARSFSVLQRVGFERVPGYAYLIVRWHRRDIEDWRQRAMIAKADAIGPF